ncbi:MAG: nucleoside 2-deoxyribosyltransferase [candidate division NC10 bacterium]|nr:nucleoside 2-deoxyribosyltransferase [candidate division NC10 bacterium]MBI2113673.1 nucleoside 2-deoxyribosyltransferase [candidate division NC10 bacterium]MBI3084554.1 nucleoside 2-deoxyribosyltransferase [candidate division NC10 bacterium]MBI3121662.1 nucleoside 2-deoxyribosyltransferase [candidate division NC10 bacterium]
MAVTRQKRTGYRIYCAGPLFNRPEQEEMAEIARTLEGAGFSVFLPHRDGFVFAEVHREFLRGGYESAEASRMIQQAIFWLDTHEVVSACQGLVLNMNGRVPDEGAVSEAAMAWMAGKPIVLYKADSRSLIQGSDNPLVLGLGNFARVSTIPEIGYAFTQVFRTWRPGKSPVLPQAVRSAVEAGRRLSRLLATCTSPADLVPIIVSLTRQATRRSGG